MDNIIIEHAFNLIEKRFEGDSSGHDYYHSKRVYSLATHIAKTEDSNIKIVQLAALLHDVDDRKLFKEDSDLECARKFMLEHNVDLSELKAVCQIIHEISFNGSDSITPSTIEGRIVQDADRLDAVGAIGIARTFAYGGSRGRKMHDPSDKPKLNMNADDYYRNEGTSINHFYEKLLKLKDKMNTAEGNRISMKRHEYMLSFLDEFYSEWQGIK